MSLKVTRTEELTRGCPPHIVHLILPVRVSVRGLEVESCSFWKIHQVLKRAGLKVVFDQIPGLYLCLPMMSMLDVSI